MGTYYLNQLQADSSKILKDNIESLEYVQGMEEILNTWSSVDTAKHKSFEVLLEKQAHNVTEVGELEATQNLRKAYFEFKKIIQKHILPNWIKLCSTLQSWINKALFVKMIWLWKPPKMPAII